MENPEFDPIEWLYQQYYKRRWFFNIEYIVTALIIINYSIFVLDPHHDELKHKCDKNLDEILKNLLNLYMIYFWFPMFAINYRKTITYICSIISLYKLSFMINAHQMVYNSKCQVAPYHYYFAIGVLIEYDLKILILILWWLYDRYQLWLLTLIYGNRVRLLNTETGVVTYNSVRIDIPAHKFDSEMEMICTICRNQINKGENVKTLLCDHIFHINCINPWLVDNDVCPNCRSAV